VLLVVHYRSFRNDDPPHLVDIWNETFTGRGAVRLRSATPLDYYLFAKPYFDPAGLILAEEDQVRLGFVHAGFGPVPAGTGLDTRVGIICMLGVRPAHQRRGIGTELLRRAETYLTSRGTQTLRAGGMRPLNPFYFGLYGGSDSPGFLRSDPLAEPFFTHRGYQQAESCVVLQRPLDAPLNAADARFSALRRRYEIVLGPRTGAGTWWQESTTGPIEMLECRMQERGATEPAARVALWEMERDEMEGFRRRSSEETVGVVELEVQPGLRRQALAKLLLLQLMRHLRDQYFTRVEAQVPAGNESALGLCRSLGFEQVDTGVVYQRPVA
jgi:ribosomal protein S18 acetylase RimI-like enzyme